MRTFVILILLAASGLMLLSACQTAHGPRNDLPRMATAPPRKNAPPRPYYRSNAAGSYYYSTREGANTDFRPGVTRNIPSGRFD